MVIQLILHGFGESVLDYNSEFTGSELPVVDGPIICLGPLALHQRWREVGNASHKHAWLAENFGFEGFQSIIANILHVVLVDTPILPPHVLPQLEP